MANAQTAGFVTRERPEPDGARARIEALRDALAGWRDVCAVRDDPGRSEAVVGTADEIATAVEVLQRSLTDAIDRVAETDIAAARERGLLTTDEATMALKEKRMRELRKIHGQQVIREHAKRER